MEAPVPEKQYAAGCSPAKAHRSGSNTATVISIKSGIGGLKLGAKARQVFSCIALCSLLQCHGFIIVYFNADGNTSTMEHWPTLQFLLLFILLALFSAICYRIYLSQTRRREQNFRILHAERIEGPDDVHRMLSLLISEKTRMKVRLNERRRTYTSCLLALTPPTMLIDELFPTEGNELIGDSQFITIEFMVNEFSHQRLHLSYSFTSKYHAAEAWRGFPALRIALPDMIIRNQKRRYLRITPPVKEPLYIRFFMNNQEYNEKIADISAGGTGFYTNLGRASLQPGTEIKNILIEIPDYCTIQCDAAVRTHRRNDQLVMVDGKPTINYCGIEFLGLDAALREDIVQYVLAKERMELKYINREFA